jgi:hypothetical protein
LDNRTLTAAIGTLSWIDKKAKIPVDDPDPGPVAKREHFNTGTTFRFSNYIEAFISFDERNRIQRWGFTDASGMYRGPSKFGLSSEVVGKIGRKIVVRGGEVSFRQLVGARTISHEVAGGAGGGTAGAVAGGVGGFMVGGPVGAFVGAVTIGAVGYFTGKEVAELIMSFPPIWTEIELTINANGNISYQLLSHSLFPSNTLYALASALEGDLRGVELQRVGYHDGDMTRLKEWVDNGWGLSPPTRGCPSPGNPWGMENPAGTIGVKLSNETPTGY